VISGQQDMEITIQLLNNGAYDYIIKDDFDTTKITRVMGKWMAAREFKKNLNIKEGKYPADNYLREISAAQEKVRKEISGELHDNVNQLLGASKLYMDIALKEEGNRVSMIRESKHILDSAITEVRKLSHSLQSANQTDFDLETELDKLISGLKKQNRFYVSTSIVLNELKQKVSATVQHEIFRIIQEQVNNIIKYAVAKKVHIGLVLNQGELQLNVIDDGVGFNLDKAPKGIGLSNIFNRVSNVNGSYTIKTAPGKGCSWKICIPFNKTTQQKVYH
jgi:signal transduction histidine kinase